MSTYITLLRGINVGGRKSISIAGLKTLYGGLGFRDTTSYIQSGNLLFKTREGLNPARTAEKISKAILEGFEAEVTVLIRTQNELGKIIASNPFIGRPSIDLKKLHVTFLDRLPEKDCLKTLSALDYPPDEFRVLGTEVYLHCPVNYGESKLSNRFFENQLQVKATTRNWNTVNALQQLAEKMG